eukprot:2595895-Pleurochrysis_carterae.AAC.1
MRRAFDVPSHCPGRFVTPVGGDAAGMSDAWKAWDTSDLSWRVGSGPTEASESASRMHKALPVASRVKAISPPSWAKRALIAASGTLSALVLDSEAASAARASMPRRSCLVA